MMIYLQIELYKYSYMYWKKRTVRTYIYTRAYDELFACEMALWILFIYKHVILLLPKKKIKI